MFEEASLFPHLWVGGNFSMVTAGRCGVASEGTRFDDVVALLGIKSLLDRAPLRLFGGERQRVAIGRSLLRSPACCSWTSRSPASTA